MSSKSAVLLCGDFRCWPKASGYIFNFVERYFDTVDYYFVTWTTTRDYRLPELDSIDSERAVTDRDVTDKFLGRNLINYKLVDINTVPKYHTNFFYQAHLGKIGNILKRRHELINDFIYDQVIELRPDVYIPIVHDSITTCRDLEYSTAPMYYAHGTTRPSMPDLYFRTNSFTNDILSTRNYHNKLSEVGKFLDVNRFTPGYETMPGTYDVHWILLDFLYNRRMFEQSDRKYEANLATVIRPNFPDNLDEYTVEQIREFSHEWARSKFPGYLF
jgi:hypothetical protein